MDFSTHDTPEIAAFRQRAAAWIRQHAPQEVRLPPEQAPVSAAVRQWAPGFQRRLAAQGWAAPSWPLVYGGGGLTPAHDQAMQEELIAARVPDLYESNRQAARGVYAAGGEQQRLGFLPGLLCGEAVAWRSLADAALAVDPELATVRAERDGDVYLVSGAALFAGAPDEPRFLWTLAVTDPAAAPARRLSAFLIPATLDGITLTPADTVAGTPLYSVMLAEAAVPVGYRIGAEGDGQMIARRMRQPDADADRLLARQEAVVSLLAAHVRETFKGRVPARRYRKLREQVADAYIRVKELRALAMRNRWLRDEGRPAAAERAQYAVLARAGQDGLAETLLDTLGPFALVNNPEWAALGGEAEAMQRPDGADAGEPLLDERMLAESLGLPTPQREPKPAEGQPSPSRPRFL
ncbi:MAG: acyl-CoA dehydrogenase family protein [Chloroflexi bacterium]|nr:acyl-CoA dehydrogenase family protein [Chloroflexota bacterium]